MKKVIVILLCLFTSIIFSSVRIQAKELKSTEVIYLNKGTIGEVFIHDDYVVEISFLYAVKDVRISICYAPSCDSVIEEKVFNETYFENGHVEFFLKQHFDLEDGESYKVETSAAFKPKAGTTESAWQVASVDAEFVYNPENAATDSEGRDKYGEKFKETSTSAAIAIRNIAIPVIYGILSVLLIIKGILLAMDITKYADLPDVRKEKIRAFIYFGVAMFALALLNTIAGFITGLFG